MPFSRRRELPVQVLGHAKEWQRCLLTNINPMELGRFLPPKRRPIEHTTRERGHLLKQNSHMFVAAILNITEAFENAGMSLQRISGSQAACYIGASMAITGGVSLMLTRDLTTNLNNLQFLNPNGRPTAFDESASGDGHGEGCGIILLKRLADGI
ncbi:hypothetical protein BDV27DRAFT_152557 [Aspergillus caelatus]|uniref:Beta-ketoacyl synthase-like N-terminal domain-containing protein n=1 Tax=Aspergillus caelatus TaxID=61420 RepID=A0A5N7ALM7_9EURO|nr:uncharacterized protein BDV27DRAFT_152557 [Aspergillus caelatus]KAE8369899.1 hypothetical protein BDV27DRAFT_152557 [Aspergillus caelatus]